LLPALGHAWGFSEQVHDALVCADFHPEVVLELVLRLLNKEVSDGLGDEVSDISQDDLEILVDSVSELLDECLVTCWHVSLLIASWWSAASVFLEVDVVREDAVLLCFDDVLNKNTCMFSLLYKYLSYDVDYFWFELWEALEDAIDNLTRQNFKMAVNVLD